MQQITLDLSDLKSIESALTFLREIFLSKNTHNQYQIEIEQAQIPIDIGKVIEFLQDSTQDTENGFPMTNEAILYLSAVQYPDLAEQIKTFIIEIVAYNAEQGKYKVLWTNEAVPFGFYAAHALALHSINNMQIWIDFIKTLDLNHEVYESAAIQSLFASHGITNETLDLAVERVLDSAGQWGHDQIRPILEPYKEHPIIAEFIKRLSINIIESYNNEDRRTQHRLELMNIFLADFYSHETLE